jgi:CheY-like chemotaxis protein
VSKSSEAELPVILVAEDDDAFRALVLGWFARIRARISGVKDGVELMKLFNRLFSVTRRLVVVTDIDMPRADGFAVIRHVRQRSSSVPIIAISGRAQDGSERDKLLAAGATVVLRKPFRRATLVAAALSALGL